MQPVQAKKRKGRPLLVAAVGIASVSYLGTIQGCADVEPTDEEAQTVASDEPEDVAQTQQALTVKPVDSAILINKRLPPVGNLMPGPGGIDIGGGGGGVIVVPIPVGNLMVTPVTPIDQIAVQPGTLVETR